MRFFRVKTRVITAQSIITKVNKSLYVTIGTSSLPNVRQLEYRPFGSPGKHIILSLCYFSVYRLIQKVVPYLAGAGALFLVLFPLGLVFLKFFYFAINPSIIHCFCNITLYFGIVSYIISLRPFNKKLV